MEVFLERLLLELAGIALQLAILRLVRWLHNLPGGTIGMVEAT